MEMVEKTDERDDLNYNCDQQEISERTQAVNNTL